MQSGTSNKIIKLELGHNNFNNLVILPSWELPNLILIHVYNTLFRFFLSRFVCVCLQSLEKVPIWAKIYCYAKIKYGHEKMQNFVLISNPLKRLQKNSSKKRYQQKKSWKNWVFDFKLLCAKVFGLYIFCYVFKEFEISPYSMFHAKSFGSYELFLQTFHKTAHNTAQKNEICLL